MTQPNESRKNFTPEEKLSIIKKHLVGKKAVSEICEQYGLVPPLFYERQQTLCEHAAPALERKSNGTKQRESRRVQQLECPACNAKHDRDTNAARNILTAGLAVLVSGENVGLVQLCGISGSL